MGGPKKPTLKQLEKRMRKQRQQQQQEKGSGGPEKNIGGVMPPSLEEAAAFVKTQPYVTPYVLSEKFGIRLSVAKNLLTKLAEAKVVRLVQGDSRLRIYAPVKLEVAEAAAEKKPEAKPSPKRRKRRK